MFVTYHTSIKIHQHNVEQDRILARDSSKNPQCEPKEQHVNIKAAIQLYEDGKIDGLESVCIMEGKVVTKEEMFKGTAWAWARFSTSQNARL
jgi:hypothetical protein